MIDWSWRDKLVAEERSEVEQLLEAAASYDAEAGFSTATPDETPAGEVHHLLVTMPPRGSRGSAELDRLPDFRVVAYLRLDVVDGEGITQFVVRPEFRSLGVATLLFERLAAEPDGLEQVPGLTALRAWAHGAHPAAERMKMRLGGSVENAVFKTLHTLGGSRPFRGEEVEVVREPASSPVPETVPGHQQALNPADREVLCRVDTVVSVPGTTGQVLLGLDDQAPEAALAPIALVRPPEGDRDDLARLLTQGLLLLQAEGARMAQCHIDALDEDVVAVSRILGFEHDQSDLLYTLQLSR